ncbi:MAG: HYR domain-containing protein [Bacteroidota bacterium]
MDNCSEAVDISVVQNPSAGIQLSILDVATVITLTATDEAGNNASCTFNITPQDEEPPAIICPEPQAIYYDANCSVILPDFTDTGMPSDNCTTSGAVSVTQSPLSGTVYTNLLPSQVIVTLFAEDGSGNMGSCDVRVELRDTISPVVTCPPDEVVLLDTNCNGELPDLSPQVAAMDNCSPNLTVLQNPGPATIYSGDGTEVVVTFTISDADGNETQCTTTVTFEDHSPPNPVICPNNQNLTVDDVCEIALPDYRLSTTIEDNCRPQEEIVLTQVPASGNLFSGDGLVIPITITADDGNGNTENCVFSVTLVDDVPVNLACPGGQIVIASGNDCTGALEDYSSLATVTNECMSPAAGVTFTQSPVAGTILDINDLDIPQSVTLTATDLNSNIANCTFQVTLIDTLPPILICPPNDVQSVDASCQVFITSYIDNATLSDNCSASNNLLITQNPAAGIPIDGPDNTQEITLTATDESGNLSSCTFILTVEDTEAPNLQCPASDTAYAVSACEATILDYTSAAQLLDNCTAQSDVVVGQVPVAGTVITGHNTIQDVEITATDDSGNGTTCTFQVTILDTVAPTIICPGNQVIRPDVDCNVVIPDYRDQATIADNCTLMANLTVTQSPTAGTNLNGQGDARLITLTVDDGNGNRTNCSFIVELLDNTPPQIICPADVTVAADANCEFDLADYRGDAAVSDNCAANDAIILSQSPGIGFTLSGEGDFIDAILTADDSHGNTAQCTFRVRLDDVTAPTIVCPPNDTVFTDGNCTALIPDFIGLAITSDNCATPSTIVVTQLPAAGTTINDHNTLTTVTLTANDGNGNSENCALTVLLLDEVNPTISCPTAQVVFTDDDCAAILPDYTDLATVMDNCTDPTGIIVTQNPVVGTDFIGTSLEVVTLTADDGNDNTVNCDFTVSIEDNTSPELVCPTLSVIPGDANCIVTLADYRDSLAVSDNCTAPAEVQLIQSPAPGSMIMGLGTNQMVTISARDESGNTVNCIVTVEIADTTQPSIACLLDTTLALTSNCAVALPDYTDLPLVTDNCDVASSLTVTQSPMAGTIVTEENTVTEVLLTAIDASGNSVSCSFGVTTFSPNPPPVANTVTLEALPDANDVGIFNLDDALDPLAEANTTDVDLDGDAQEGPGPYLITYYASLEEAIAGQNGFSGSGYQSTDGGVVLVRIEDPASGCFTISQILLGVRTRGTTDLAATLTHCNKRPFTLEIDGLPQPAGQATSLTHQWTLIDAGETRITVDRLINPTDQVVAINTEGLRSGFFILAYQFFEDYGNGPIVASTPARITIELTNVGAGNFFWNGQE